ncbi:MAG: hypothetical protein KDA86_08120 [Planctomycetaceae bacterium]|nr:hypothetical protein [Planctomycetaceae bacterium]
MPIAAMPPVEFLDALIYWLVLAIVGIIAFFYLLAPLAIFGSMKLEANPRVIRFDLGDYEWPEAAQRLFEQASSTLEKNGFVVTEGFFLPSVISNVKTAGVLLLNRQQRDAAMIVAMYGLPVSAESLKTMFVEFSTSSLDGHVYDTNNSSQLSSFPRPSNKTTNQLPQITDTEILYRIHQAVMQHDGISTSSKSFRIDTEYNGDVITLLQDSMRDEFEKAEAAGYLKRADETYFAPTIKGAFLMVWKELWPARTIRQRSRDRRAQALLNELQRQGLEIT